MRLTHRLFFIVVLSLALVACTQPGYTPSDYPDPYEKYNRNAFRANDKLDRWIIQPVAKGYKAITPSFFRTGVSNFFDNISLVNTVVNDLLQLRLSWLANDLTRLVVNSTIGVGGLIDVAKPMGLAPHRNSFDMTLESWGAKPTPYLVLPFFGPTTLAGATGFVFDYYASPWYWVLRNDPFWISEVLYLYQGLNTRAMLLDSQGLAMVLALDPYIFMRSASLQHHVYEMNLMKNGPANAGKTD